MSDDRSRETLLIALTSHASSFSLLAFLPARSRCWAGYGRGQIGRARMRRVLRCSEEAGESHHRVYSRTPV